MTRLLGDEAAAAAAVQRTWVHTWDRAVPTGACPVSLFTTAYAVAAPGGRGRRAGDGGRPARGRPAPGPAPGVGGDPGAGRAAIDPALVPPGTDLLLHQELAHLVWDWARRLKRPDYALVDLHLRHGFGPEETGRILGLRPAAAGPRLARLAGQAQTALAPAVLARQTPVECPALADELAKIPDGTPLSAMGRSLRGHLHRCAICANNRREVPSPIAVLATLLPVPLSRERLEELWAGVSVGVKARPPKVRPRPAHHETHHHRPAIPRPVVLTALAVGVTAILLGAVLAGGDGGTAPETVRDPTDIASVSHVAGAASPRSRVSVTWTAVPGARGYSVRWTQAAGDIPDRMADLDGSATRSTSPELPAGRWWFHLRTQSASGRWTDSSHLGPFVIVAPATTTTSTTTTLPPTLPTFTTSPTRPAPTTTLPPPTLPPPTLPPPTLPPLTTTTTRPPTTLPPTTTTLPPTTTTLPPTTTTTTPPPAPPPPGATP